MNTEIFQVNQALGQRRAVEILKAGGLVAFPTDTVYGVAALAWHEAAVAQLYVAKQRPTDRPIPLLLSDGEHLPRVAVSTPVCQSLMARFWPGGLTLILSKTEAVPDVVSAGSTVAVRVPDLRLARDLIRAAGGVLAVTSANISGQASPVTAQDVERQLGGRIALILDGGPCRAGTPSSIVDCTTSPPLLRRRGAVSETELRAALGSTELSSIV